jgi:glycosyltransferase involved in cell wall biosynthesis
MEALAMGRPVITTAVAGIPELVDRECGWLISAGSADALTTAMREALSASTATLTAMGLVGRNRVRRMHDASRNAAELVQAIASFKLDPQPEPTSSADPGSDFGSAL